MTEVNEIYKCEICGNVVSTIENGPGKLVCCGQPMDLMEENAIEKEGNEKHVPIVEITDGKVKVKVGSVPHPMEDAHFIELIELLQNGKVIVSKVLKPTDEPIAEFLLKNTDNLSARSFCNVHGLWKS